MYGPRVFISMICTLAVFATATYFLTNSLSATLIETLICAVLLQIGYFVGILFLVWKARKTPPHPGHMASASKQFTWKTAGQLGDDTTASVQVREDDKPASLPAAGLKPPDPFKH